MPRITSKGQVTIPNNIRKKFGVKTGDRAEFSIEKGKVVVSFHKGTILDAIRQEENDSSPGRAKKRFVSRQKKNEN
ncbi:MAG: AbrB/MazE/SpoVT family DNA-binding domain-containing protein [Actinomycetia bacterium]|nr:AbrB/MazE/SpoVT family DNA-binding domain-containing protein [Actinomycetes bacterium]